MSSIFYRRGENNGHRGEGRKIQEEKSGGEKTDNKIGKKSGNKAGEKTGKKEKIKAARVSSFL